MKRDMDLVREILLALEGIPAATSPSTPEIDGFSNEQVGSHVHLMIEGGLLDGSEVTSLQSKFPEYISLSITWDGYDFLELSKNSSVWKDVKDQIRERGVSVSFDLLRKLLTTASARLMEIL